MNTRADLEKRIAELERSEQQRRAALEALEGATVTDLIAPVYLPLHQDIAESKHQYYNLPGGRGSCKSSFVSLEIVGGIMADATGRTNAIVFRRTGATMRESVFSQIAWAIDMLGVGGLWRGSVSPMAYTYTPTGAQIIFRGLDQSSKLKSIKPKRGVFRFVWFEEFAELPGPNFTRSVQQSVIRGGADFVIFRSFNPPISANAWANTFIQEPDARATTLLTDYTMIPPEWLGPDFLAEAERLKAINPKAYEHEYLGIPTGTGGEVFPNLEIREIPDEEAQRQEYLFHGVDFGFAVDPACVMRVSYDRKRETILFLGEIYQRHLSNAQLVEAIKEKGWEYTGKTWTSYLYGPGVHQEETLFVCDAAEPKSIADLHGLGLHCMKCHKEPGCVAYRVKWLQHRKIVIDPARTPNAYREFVNYSYSTDKDGNFIADLPDKDNHCIDATAYALDRQIYTSKAPA